MLTPAVLLQLATGGGTPSRVLTLEVTDESDAFFLHTMVLGEAEYAGLRADQALLVDFASFPTHLLQLLESCVAAKGEASPRCVGRRRAGGRKGTGWLCTPPPAGSLLL